MQAATQQTREDRFTALQQKDVKEMDEIKRAARENGGDAAAACSKVVGGEFKLHETVQKGITENADSRQA